MRIAFKLAYKNLINGGIRTWLNVVVLAFVFVLILFYKGLIEGWNESAVIKQIDWEYAQGQIRHQDYEPENSFTYQDAHGKIEDFKAEGLEPILLRQASIYPNGRLLNILIKGIKADQSIIKIPTKILATRNATLPALIGKRMAANLQAEIGDEILVRWRDKNGTFDAANITVVDIFNTDVASVDQGQIWMPIQKVWEMTGLNQEATYYLVKDKNTIPSHEGWTYNSQETLLKPFRNMVEIESVSGKIFYFVLLGIALLAIFDTQVLSIFRRQREIGTYIALGMTRKKVLAIFTIEGSMYSIFAVVIGTIIGIPLMLYVNHVGISLGDVAENYAGTVMGESIHPTLSLSLLVSTILIIVLSASVVSFLPAMKISKLNPVLALKGKLQ